MKNGIQINSENSQKIIQLEEVNEEIDYLKELSKLTTARSCAELKSFGVDFNGTELVPIDPDGPVKGRKYSESTDVIVQGLLKFIWTEGYSGRSSNPGLALAILVL